MAEGGGLLNLPRSCCFNLPNNLHMGASALKWGDSTSFGCICSPVCSPLGGTVSLSQARRRRLFTTLVAP